jgi:hypothetical protein
LCKFNKGGAEGGIFFELIGVNFIIQVLPPYF